MSDFFHGWRRKAGCALLVMAAGLTGGWIRSLSSHDCIYFPIGERTHEITSFNGGLLWSSWDHVTSDWGFHLDIKGFDKTFVELVARWSNRYYASWNVRFWNVFYWQLAIPLALLSACLILQPGKRAAKRPQTDQTPVDGV